MDEFIKTEPIFYHELQWQFWQFMWVFVGSIILILRLMMNLLAEYFSYDYDYDYDSIYFRCNKHPSS